MPRVFYGIARLQRGISPIKSNWRFPVLADMSIRYLVSIGCMSVHE